jgi:hypothetical protein
MKGGWELLGDEFKVGEWAKTKVAGKNTWYIG